MLNPLEFEVLFFMLNASSPLSLSHLCFVPFLSSFTNPLTFLPSFLSSPSLRDVGYGVADLQTPPVDGSEHGEESEEDQKNPGDVDPFRVLSGTPRSSHESCSGGGKDDEEQEAQQAPPPGVMSTNRRDFSAVWTSGQSPV